MLIHIDPYSEKPIFEQLREAIVRGIASKQLAENEPLPSARSLAADLGVNFHTVNKAYDALRTGGYIIMNKRTTAVVAPMKTHTAVPDALAERLALCAAEAICNGMDEKAFAAFCAESHRKLTGGTAE